jgi:hypothetical protein
VVVLVALDAQVAVKDAPEDVKVLAICALGIGEVNMGTYMNDLIEKSKNV